MTNERHQKIKELVKKLKDCLETCDELHDEEQDQRERLAENRMRIAAGECEKPAEKLMNAFVNIQEAITELEGIEG